MNKDKQGILLIRFTLFDLVNCKSLFAMQAWRDATGLLFVTKLSVEISG